MKIRNQEELTGMCRASIITSKVLDALEERIVPGVTTAEIDEFCHKMITEVFEAIPACLGYNGFPKSVCTSVNHQACHGIPNDKELKDGDIINVDVTTIKDGYHGDASRMYAVGNISQKAERLIRVAKECMFKGIEQVRPGAYTGDIGHAIEEHAKKNRYSIVKEFSGHGIGKVFHEEPWIYSYGTPSTGDVLQQGMVFTVEPVINEGKPSIKLLEDGWTAITKDRKLSAQWEHTVLVTKDGHRILTK